MNWQMRLWIDALRSGEYEQGSGALQTRDGKFCCLGVLCDVYRKETGDGAWVNDVDSKPFKTDNGMYGGAYPPVRVYVWLGVEYIDLGTVEGIYGPVMPVVANDTLRWTFDQIADALERRYAGT